MTQHVVAADGGQVYDWANDRISVKTPDAATHGRVTVVEDTLKPGFHLPRHYDRRMVEVFYILQGEMTFAFDDAIVVATPGMTLNVLPKVRHEVTCEAGGKMLTVFTPGGFDRYLAELADLSGAQLADADLMVALGNRYDTWPDPAARTP
jgi:quercetin dioxygenase-like cupin family protein